MSTTRRRLRLLTLWGMLALPCGAAAAPVSASTAAAPTPVPTPAPGSVESSQIRLEAGDAAGALADAELVIAKGGGAEAFAARADAKRALGRPYEEVLADYALAAKLDPRHIVKYDGFMAQRESEIHPTAKRKATGLNGVPMRFIVGVGVFGALSLVGAAVVAQRRRNKPGVPVSTDNKPIVAATPPAGADAAAKTAVPTTAVPPADKPEKS